ncbi:hypothetical protein CEP53_009030 [Fusarium sp. AF-6]|nr:hypothetical protein CEP53_009030 [Fusarium sp. AF-6]
MPRLPDLVSDSKLETDLVDSCTRHSFSETGSSLSTRRLFREERWQRRDILGHGAYGMVHLEKCITSKENKVRAVKEITKGVLGGARNNWVHEVEALVKFSHPKYNHCFVSSQGWYELKNRTFVTMEFLELGDLQSNLNDEPLSEFEARQITRQVLEGVGYMHDNGFLHQDLKPSNIMVVSRDPDWFVKIGDFGISRRLSDDIDTSDPVYCGTPGYMAPQFNGPATSLQLLLSPDMWSLGCIAYKILTGALPFPQLRHLFRYCVLGSKFPREPLHTCKVSDRGQDFVLGLLQARPEHRMTAVSATRHPWMTASLDPVKPRPPPARSR